VGESRAGGCGGKSGAVPVAATVGGHGGVRANRRAELWSNLKAALSGRFSIPDRDSLQGDLTSVGFKYNSAGQLVLESKQDMRRRGIPSPDEGDAMALCFTEPRGSPIIRSRDFHRKIDYSKLDRTIV